MNIQNMKLKIRSRGRDLVTRIENDTALQPQALTYTYSLLLICGWQVSGPVKLAK